MAPRHSRAWLAAIGLVSLAVAQPAPAQLSVSLRVASDERWRGRSLSADRPVVAATIAYDAPGGVYVDGAATAAWARGGLVALTGGAIDAGYAWRAPGGVALDIGATRQQFTRYASSGRPTGYTELYGGITGRSPAARLAYSPDYFARGSHTLYAGVDAVTRPATDWRLTAHAGLLAYLSPIVIAGARPLYYDYGIGAARRLKAIELRLDLSSGGPGPSYYGGRAHGRTALVAGAMVAF